jgi:hypothetical protein
MQRIIGMAQDAVAFAAKNLRTSYGDFGMLLT